jgi:TonB family protein
MKKASFLIAWVAWGLWPGMSGFAGQVQEPLKSFAYAGGALVITAEVAGPHEFVLNFINLSDYVIVVQANDFIYQGTSGRFYIGQVFDQPTKTTRGETFRYSATVLLNNSSFKGLNVLGAFRELDAIQELSVRIGSKRYFLDPMNKNQFAQFGSKVENIDMKITDAAASMRSAGVPEAGRVKSGDGTTDWDKDWQSQLMPDGINPPRHLESPEIAPTEDAKKTNTYGTVRLSATITRDGTIRDLVVVKGLGHGLDERAMEAVRTSWVFLPATRNGEVVEASAKFDVTFSPPKK